jgi:hypothetical protein
MAQEPGNRPDYDDTDRSDEDAVGKMPLAEESGDEYEEIEIADVEDGDEREER